MTTLAMISPDLTPTARLKQMLGLHGHSEDILPVQRQSMNIFKCSLVLESQSVETCKWIGSAIDSTLRLVSTIESANGTDLFLKAVNWQCTGYAARPAMAHEGLRIDYQHGAPGAAELPVGRRRVINAGTVPEPTDN